VGQVDGGHPALPDLVLEPVSARQRCRQLLEVLGHAGSTVKLGGSQAASAAAVRRARATAAVVVVAWAETIWTEV
jgi:hypothetical protein